MPQALGELIHSIEAGIKILTWPVQHGPAQMLNEFMDIYVLEICASQGLK